MKLIYLTAKTYPATTADHIYVREISNEFSKVLGDDYTLMINGNNSSGTDELKKIKTVSIDCRWQHFRSIYIYFWLYGYLKREWTADSILMSNDANLIAMSIFIRHVFRFKYKICMDWHHTYNSFLMTQITKSADFNIALTKSLAEILIQTYKIRTNQIVISPDAVDLSVFDTGVTTKEARELLSLPQDKCILLYTGRFRTLHMEKGISYILEALKRLDGDFIFYAVGGDDMEIDFYTRMSDALGVSGRCTFIGFGPQSKLALWQKAADICLMPFPWNEHFAYYMSPMKLFEYMASKRPIISSDLPSVRDILDESNSLLVKAGDIKALGGAIVKIKNDKVYSQAIAERAYRDVTERYTWEKKIEKIVIFLKGS